MLAAAGKADAQLPAGWTDTDIGSPSQPGSASYSAGNWSVSGGGADIWNTSDQFNFCYSNSTAYAVMIARVTSVQATDPWAKAGVMVRESDTADSAYATVVVTAKNPVYSVLFLIAFDREAWSLGRMGEARVRPASHGNHRPTTTRPGVALVSTLTDGQRAARRRIAHLTAGRFICEKRRS